MKRAFRATVYVITAPFVLFAALLLIVAASVLSIFDKDGE